VLPARAILTVLFAPIAAGGDSQSHVILERKQPLTGGELGPADAAFAGLEGSGLLDQLLGDGATLSPNIGRDRRGTLEAAVLQLDMWLAQGAFRPGGPDTPHRQLAEPGIAPLLGHFRLLFRCHSHLNLLPQPLGIPLFEFSSQTLLDNRHGIIKHSLVGAVDYHS
jgi:hypothetical protein